jgi:hypothetical protein
MKSPAIPLNSHKKLAKSIQSQSPEANFAKPLEIHGLRGKGCAASLCAEQLEGASVLASVLDSNRKIPLTKSDQIGNPT